MHGHLQAGAGFIKLQIQIFIMAFSFFRKKENVPVAGVFTDKAYMNTLAKMNACLERARKEPNTLFICWFPDTIRQFREFFNQQGVDDTCIMECPACTHGIGPA